MATFIEHQGKQAVPLWINGKNLPVDSSRLIEVTRAVEDRTIHYAQGADEADAKAAVGAATAAFPGWSATPLPKRREIINNAAALLIKRVEEIGAMQTLETSAQPQFGPMMARGGAETIKEIASQITNACAGDLPHSEKDDIAIMAVRQPMGPVLFISPWNAPTFLGPRGIASALAAGCTVVLKASELCPATYHMLCQCFADAGVPAGVLNQIVARREDASAITEAIISDPRIRKVEFIGSANVGSIIGQTCAKYLKPILMELGGKGPSIICRDANLQEAAKACAFGAFVHHGQICMATERIFVVREVADEFTRLLKEEVNNWVDLAGSAATKEFAEKTQAMVKEAKDAGAEFLAGDNQIHGTHGTSLRPTIITNVSRNTKLYADESFGPSASLYVVDDEDKAMELANESKYGLTGSIWSSDTMRALSLAKRLEVGVVNVNAPTVVVEIPPTISAQAAKGSGWGDVNGAAGIREFLTHKAILLR